MEHEPRLITPAMLELVEHILFVGAGQLSRSLELIHDMALYHSNLPIDIAEKHALLDMKILMQYLDKIADDNQRVAEY